MTTGNTTTGDSSSSKSVNNQYILQILVKMLDKITTLQQIGQSNLQYFVYQVTKSFTNSLKAFSAPNVPNSYKIGAYILERYVPISIDSNNLPSALLPAGDANITAY